MSAVARTTLCRALFFTALWLRQSQSYIDADTATQGYRFHLLQDVTDQVRYMLTSVAHVP